VVAVAMGWGGEMAVSHRDLPAVPIRARTASDVAMLRLPASLFGYDRESTEAALRAVAGLVAEQDAEIARLRGELWRLSEPKASEPKASEPKASEPKAAEAGPSAADSDGIREVLSGHTPTGGQQPPPS